MRASGAPSLQWTAARLPPTNWQYLHTMQAFDSLCNDPACNPCCSPQNSSTERLKQFVLMEPLIVKPRIPVSALHCTRCVLGRWLVVSCACSWVAAAPSVGHCPAGT